MVWLLAQQGGGTDPLASVVAGWSSFGLAGLVLAWLMLVHLPGVLKSHKEALESKDTLINKVVDNFREEMKAERQGHDAEMKALREEFNETSTRLADLLLSNTSETRLLSAAVTNLAQQAGLCIGPGK